MSTPTMTSHPPSATPGAHTSDNTPTSQTNPREFITEYRWWIIGIPLFVVVMLFLKSQYDEHKQKAESQKQTQVQMQRQAADHSLRFCGSGGGEPDCTCKGKTTTMRLLEPGEKIYVSVRRSISFYPKASPDVLRIGDPISGTTTVIPDENLSLRSSSVTAENLMKKVLPLRCTDL